MENNPSLASLPPPPHPPQPHIPKNLASEYLKTACWLFNVAYFSENYFPLCVIW